MSVEKGALLVTLDDGRRLSLSASDWIGEGGEGAVYKKGFLAVKILEDRGALVRKEPKLKIFKGISHPQLATPTALAYDSCGALLGYAMPMVEGIPLARLMAPAWRAANGYGEKKLDAVGRSMAEAVQALHAAGCWGGDLNEFNWRVKGESAVLIDCDSWGAPGQAVSAMMPSIADPAAGGRYEERSDWYALAVLLFSLYAGIHPFRGSLPGFGPRDMTERMRRGASMMRPGASWPASVPGPEAVPKRLRPWLESTLEGSLREPPPALNGSRDKKEPKPVKAQAASDLPASFARWIAPGWALLEDGSVFDIEARSAMEPPSLEAGRWIDPESGAAWWLWQDGSLLRGRAAGGASELQAELPAGSRLAFWGEEAFALRPGAWSCYAIRRLGSRGPKALARAQGPLGTIFEAFEGCLVVASLGSHALLRPIGGGRGALALALRPPERGARLAMALSAGSFEFADWTLVSGERTTLCSKRGSPTAKIQGVLDWACALGEANVLAQVDGKAWIVSSSEARELAGWAPSSAPASCWRGSLWRVEAGSAQAKSYSTARIIEHAKV